MSIHDTAKSEVDIKIIGMQWRWKYEYLNEGVSFNSSLSTPQRQMDGYDAKGQFYLREVDNPLVIPIHKKIRFLVTSSDVQHSWWVPEFGVKRDAIPGLLTSSWARVEKPGIYRGKCTELCGMHHGYMPIVVYAVTEKDYSIWLKSMRAHRPLSQKILTEMAAYHAPDKAIEKSIEQVAVEQKNTAKTDPLTEAVEQGKAIYTKYCIACHLQTGKGMPPVFKALAGSEIVTRDIQATINILLYGVQGKAMQAFGTQLTDKEIADVITYIRNSWDNANQALYGDSAGGLVSAEMVSKYRDK